MQSAEIYVFLGSHSRPSSLDEASRRVQTRQKFLLPLAFFSKLKCSQVHIYEMRWTSVPTLPLLLTYLVRVES